MTIILLSLSRARARDEGEREREKERKDFFSLRADRAIRHVKFIPLISRRSSSPVRG